MQFFFPNRKKKSFVIFYGQSKNLKNFIHSASLRATRYFFFPLSLPLSAVSD